MTGPPPVELEAIGADDGCTDTGASDAGAADAAPPGTGAPADAEQMIWALEHIFAAARIDPALLDHFAAASICGLAYRDGTTPRHILEALFRRSIGDDRWENRYAGLFPNPPETGRA